MSVTHIIIEYAGGQALFALTYHNKNVIMPVSWVFAGTWGVEIMVNGEAEALAADIARQVVALRHARGLTQAALAQRVGTRQSGIARLEGGRHLPSLALLQRVADAVGARVEVTFRLGLADAPKARR